MKRKIASAEPKTDLQKMQDYFEENSSYEASKEKFKAFLDEGYHFEQVALLCNLGHRLNVPMEELILQEECTSSECQAPQFEGKPLHFNSILLNAYMAKNQLSQEDIEKIFTESQVLSDTSDEIEIRPLASGEEKIFDTVSFPDAPFGYNASESESVQLNSGALRYTVTDFVLPGKNGLDLSIGRLYDSSLSSDREFRGHRLVFREEYIMTFEVIVSVKYFAESKVVSSWYGTMASGTVYGTKSVCNAQISIAESDVRQQLAWDRMMQPLGITQQYSLTTYKRTVDTYEVYTYVTRKRERYLQNYGLGYGWSFQFASVSGSTYENGTIYIHTGDGRIFAKPAGIGKKLLDKQGGLYYENVSGILNLAGGKSVNYKHILHYKNGQKHYIGDTRIAAIQDKYGNTISFEHLDNDEMEITDTFGRTIKLEREVITESQFRFHWRGLPDDAIYSYEVWSSLGLTSVYDFEGNITEYRNAYVKLEAYLYPQSDIDTAILNGHFPLSQIRYPSGHKTIFDYIAKRVSHSGAYWDELVLDERSDPESGVTKYDYTFASGINKRITQTVVTTPEAKSIHKFDTSSKKTEEITQDLDGNIKTHKKFSYDTTVNLISKEESVLPYKSTTSYTYNKDGDMLTQTNALGHIIEMEYHSTYHYPIKKKFKTNENTTVEERYIPTSDQLDIEWIKVLVNGKLQRLTQNIYSADHLPVEQRAYFTDIEHPTDYVFAKYIYENAMIHAPTTSSTGHICCVSGSSPYQEAVRVAQIEYDNWGRAVTKTDANGNKTTYRYDACGRVLEEIYPDGTSRKTEYFIGESQNDIVVTNENHYKMRFVYTPMGKASKEIDEDNNVLLRSFGYTNGRLSSETQYLPDGQVKVVKTVTYDCLGRPVAEITTDGSGEELSAQYFSYDDENRTTQKKVAGDGDGPDIISVEATDILGRITWKSLQNDTSKYVYDFMGNCIETTNVQGEKTYCEYDFAGRPIKQTNPIGQTVASEYDILGNLTETRDHVGRSTYYFYDSLGRIIEQKMPFDGAEQQVTRFSYDLAGNLLKKQIICSLPGEAEKWQISRFTYDCRNRVKDVILEGDEENYRTVYEYDNMGNTAAVVSGLIEGKSHTGAKTQYTYNRFGKVLSLTDPRCSNLDPSDVEYCSAQYVYDNTGRLVSKTARNGNKISYTYDARDRVIKESVWANNQVESETEYTYTKTGQRCSEKNSVLAISYRYNNKGQLIKQTESDGTVKEYQYNSAGKRTAFILSRGGQKEIHLQYAYDQINRLVEVRNMKIYDDGYSVIVRYQYDSKGNQCSTEYPENNVVMAYGYNDANMLTSLKTTCNDTEIGTYHYSYYLDGNKHREVKDHVVFRTFAYDKLGRLVQEDLNGTQQTDYQYDRFFNRLSMAVSGPEPYSVQYAYHDNNWLLSQTKSTPNTSEVTQYQYDPSGNLLWQKRELLTEKTKEAGRISFSAGNDPASSNLRLRKYNGLNQLERAYCDGNETCYRYRPDGLRYDKMSGSQENMQTKTHFWDGKYMVAESEDGNADNVYYLRGKGLIAYETNGERTYYQFNAKGDVVGCIAQNGTVASNYEYDAFGVQVSKPSSDKNPFRYCAEYHDPETDTVYLRARHYMPSIGRFDREDPHWGPGSNALYGDSLIKMPGAASIPNGQAVIQSNNLYVYCMHNPLAYQDEDGEAFLESLIAIGVGGAIGGAVSGGMRMYDNWRHGRPLTDQLAKYATSGFVGGAVGAAATLFMATTIFTPVVGAFIAGGLSNVASTSIQHLFDHGTILMSRQKADAAFLQGGIAGVVAHGISGPFQSAFEQKALNNFMGMTKPAQKKIYESVLPSVTNRDMIGVRQAIQNGYGFALKDDLTENLMKRFGYDLAKDVIEEFNSSMAGELAEGPTKLLADTYLNSSLYSSISNAYEYLYSQYESLNKENAVKPIEAPFG